MTDNAGIDWTQVLAAKGSGELFRYHQRGATLVYKLNVLADGRAEVTRVTERAGKTPTTDKVATFAESDAATADLRKIRRMLEGDGWKEVKA